MVDHGFLAELASEGRDVYLYEQAGGGRSDVLPMGEYSLNRSLDDLYAVLDRIGERVDLMGYSAGGILVAQALARAEAQEHIASAIMVDSGPMDGPTAAIEGGVGRPNARGVADSPAVGIGVPPLRYGVEFGFTRLGLLSPKNALMGQEEALNAFGPEYLGSEVASFYCAADADRVQADDSPENWSFNVLASLAMHRDIRSSGSIAEALGQSSVPEMVMIGECSTQTRAWSGAIIQAYPAVERVQFMPGVGHQIWNGLDDNDERALDVVTAFLNGEPAPLPNWPTRDDLDIYLSPEWE